MFRSSQERDIMKQCTDLEGSFFFLEGIKALSGKEKMASRHAVSILDHHHSVESDAFKEINSAAQFPHRHLDNMFDSSIAQTVLLRRSSPGVSVKMIRDSVSQTKFCDSKRHLHPYLGNNHHRLDNEKQ